MYPATTVAHAPAHQAFAQQNVTRMRSTSAPIILCRTPARAMPVPLTEDVIDKLMADLVPASARHDVNAQRTETCTSGNVMTPAEQLGGDIDSLLDDLFDGQLNTIAGTNKASERLERLSIALDMLPNVSSGTAGVAAGRLAATLAETDGGATAMLLAQRLIDIFVSQHLRRSQEQCAEAAEAFVNLFANAIAHYPQQAACRLAVRLLWGAKKLACFTMGSQAAERFTTLVTHHDPTITCQRIQAVALHLKDMPPSYRCAVAAGLYRHAPEEGRLRLLSLEAIAAALLDETQERAARSFCGLLNQRIYELRIELEAREREPRKTGD